VGPRVDAPDADHRVSCSGACVIPGFVDSHTHLVFAGERSAEFAARMSGQPYEAGGITSTVTATRGADDATLLAGVERLADELLRAGVTTFECKSGYGLTVEDEARSLRIAKAVTDETTFLGAHVVPAEFRDDRAAYIDLITGPMLQACAPHARWVDVFCDRGAFDVDEARHILHSGMAAGLVPRLHAGQLGPSAGIRLAVELKAASVDHCTYATDDDVDALAGAAATTVATLLPGAEFSTRAQYPDGKRLIDAGATVALATDCNPGSSFTTSMPFCIAVAVRDMNFTPAQAVWAATAGGAAALRRGDVGVLAPGRRADFVRLDAPSHIHLAYRPGVPLVRDVVRAGEHLFENLETRS
jgi:imidazolonepropionase